AQDDTTSRPCAPFAQDDTTSRPCAPFAQDDTPRRRLPTGHSAACAPGSLPMLIRNSPTISPPMNRNCFFITLTHCSLLSSPWASSQLANEPCDSISST